MSEPPPPIVPKVSVDGERIYIYFSLLIIYLLLHVDRQGLQIHAFETRTCIIIIIICGKKNKCLSNRTPALHVDDDFFFRIIFLLQSLPYRSDVVFETWRTFFQTAPRRKNAQRNLERTA